MNSVIRIPVVEQVMHNLQELITERGYQPGDRMPTEKEACEMFHVGRSTVREAYRMLQIMGILESKQGSGSIVARKIGETRQNSAENWFRENGVKVTDYLETRMAIEPMVTSLAIQRATDDEVKKIERIHGLFCHAVEQNHALEMAKYDEAFHMSIAEASHNPLFVKIEELIAESIFEYRIQSFSIQGNAAHAISPHQTILYAFLHRDAKTGESAVIGHLRISEADMEKAIKQAKS